MTTFSRRRRVTSTRPLAIRPARSIGVRVGTVVGLVLVILISAYLVFDAGRRAAGFNEKDSSVLVGDLRQTVDELRTELAEARRIGDSAESLVQMERAAKTSLAGIVKGLESENSRLKSELAVFERIAGGDQGASEFVISRIDIRPDDVAGSYRYRMLLARTGALQARDFSGHLEFVISARKGTDTITMRKPRTGTDRPIAVSFKRFTRVEGAFEVGAIDSITSVEVRLVDGSKVVASEMFRP